MYSVSLLVSFPYARMIVVPRLKARGCFLPLLDRWCHGFIFSFGHGCMSVLFCVLCYCNVLELEGKAETVVCEAMCPVSIQRET